MRKLKLYPAPRVELRILVSDQMEADYKECQRQANLLDGRGNCDNCSWRDVEIDNTGLCEWLTVYEALKEDRDDGAD